MADAGDIALGAGAVAVGAGAGIARGVARGRIPGCAHFVPVEPAQHEDDQHPEQPDEAA